MAKRSAVNRKDGGSSPPLSAINIRLRRTKGWEQWPPKKANWVVTASWTTGSGYGAGFHLIYRYFRRLGWAKRFIRTKLLPLRLTA